MCGNVVVVVFLIKVLPSAANVHSKSSKARRRPREEEEEEATSKLLFPILIFRRRRRRRSGRNKLFPLLLFPPPPLAFPPSDVTGTIFLFPAREREKRKKTPSSQFAFPVNKALFSKKRPTCIRRGKTLLFSSHFFSFASSVYLSDRNWG